MKKNWKGIVYDYGLFESFDNTQECVYCLTERDAAILRSALFPMYWETRWKQPPSELDNLIAEIEGKLNMGSCIDLSELTRCVCEINATLQGEYWKDNPVKPDPVDPLPDTPPFSNVERVEAATCEAAKLMTRSITKAIIDAYNTSCGSDSDPDWPAIAASSAAFLIAIAAVPATGGASLVIRTAFRAGVAAAGVNFGLEVEGIFENGDEDCPAGPLSDEFIARYACCLFDATYPTLNLESFQGAWDERCQGAVDWMVDAGVPVLIAEAVDEANRGMLAPFLKEADNYIAYIGLIEAIVENEYVTPSLCDECFDCASKVLIAKFDPVEDARVTVTPAPVVETVGGGDLYTWPAGWQIINFTFAEPTCIVSLEGELMRGSTGSCPQGFKVLIGGQTIDVPVGGLGNDPWTVTFGTGTDGVPTRSISIVPRSGGGCNGNEKLQFFCCNGSGFDPLRMQIRENA